MSHKVEKDRLRKGVSEFLKTDSASNREFRSQLRRLDSIGSRAYLFGGFVRDIFLNGVKAQPKDVDLVVEGDGFDELLKTVKPEGLRTNRFGGVNFRLGAVDVDAWRLEDTWAFRAGYFRDAIGVRTLPKTTYLSVDAIAVQLRPEPGRSRRVFEAGFFQSIERQLLDLNLEENPFPELMVVRTLVMAKRGRFALSWVLLKALHSLILDCGLRDLYQVQLSHYKHCLLSKEELKDVAHEIMRRVNLEIHQAFDPFPGYHQESLGFPSPSELGLMRHRIPGVQLDLL
jgi:hypothetical protein